MCPEAHLSRHHFLSFTETKPQLTAPAPLTLTLGSGYDDRGRRREDVVIEEEEEEGEAVRN